MKCIRYLEAEGCTDGVISQLVLPWQTKVEAHELTRLGLSLKPTGLAYPVKPEGKKRNIDIPIRHI